MWSGLRYFSLVSGIICSSILFERTMLDEGQNRPPRQMPYLARDFFLPLGLPGLTLSGIATRDQGKAQAWLDREGISCPLILLDDVPAHAELVLECAPAAILDQICRPMLNAGKEVMVLSASALLPRPDLVDLARARGGQIIVPTGALIGLDAVSAAAEGPISKVQMITRKPPAGRAVPPYLIH